MANTYLTISMITFEMLMVLHNNLVAGKKVTRTWEKQFARTGAKIGANVQIRKPPRYIVVDGQTFVPQDYTEEYVPLTINQHKQVGCEWASDDLTLNMDDFSRRFLKPALVPMANQVDLDILANLLNQVWNATGTPGTTAATDTPFVDAKSVLANNSAMITEDMPMLVTPKVSGRLSSGLAGRYNPQPSISDLYLKGAMSDPLKGSEGHALGWDFFSTQTLPVFTTGAWAGTSPTVSTANQSGSAINTTGWTVSITGLGKTNDVVQFAGVYGVNPVTFLSTGELQNFRLTADVNSDSSGNATLNVYPPLYANAGKNTTVSALPGSSAAVMPWGQSTVANVASKVSPQCFGWQVEAVTLACVDLYVPEEGMGVKAIRVSDDDLGLSFVFMSGFDPRAYSKLSRIDILYGTTAVRPEHVVRVAS
jgi:hypothetical protein